jgi:hypothetical protein
MMTGAGKRAAAPGRWPGTDMSRFREALTRSAAAARSRRTKGGRGRARRAPELRFS